MNAEILGIVQDFSFANGEMQNYLKLRLPNGAILQAAVDAQAALATMGAFYGQPGADSSTLPSQAVAAGWAEEENSEAEAVGNFAPVRLPDDEPHEETEAFAASMPTPAWGADLGEVADIDEDGVSSI